MPRSVRHWFLVEWRDEGDELARAEIASTPEEALALANKSGLAPANVDLVVVLAGAYAARGGPILPYMRKHAYWRLRGVWHVPGTYREGGVIPLSCGRRLLGWPAGRSPLNKFGILLDHFPLASDVPTADYAEPVRSASCHAEGGIATPC